MRKKDLIRVCIGNIFEHFDKALYALLAPCIAPLFFPHLSYMGAIITLFLPFGWLSRPIGAYFFGKIGDTHSKERALYFSILGMSLITICIGLLPTYNKIGVASPILLILFRAALSFFAAGETTGAALTILEKAKEGQEELFSSLYEVSGMIGAILATLSVATFLYFDQVHQYWRILFLLGGCLGVIGYLFRYPYYKSKQKTNKPFSLFSTLRQHPLQIAVIIAITGFSYANYEIIMSMMNLFFPMVMNVSYLSMLVITAILMLLDALFLPLFGWIAKMISKEKLMQYSLFAFLGIAPLISLFLQSPTLTKIFIFRFLLVLIGVSFAAPFQAYVKDIAGARYPFTILSLSKSIGAQCIGYPAIALSLTLFHHTQSLYAIILYPMVVCLISMVLMNLYHSRQRVVQIH